MPSNNANRPLAARRLAGVAMALLALALIGLALGQYGGPAGFFRGAQCLVLRHDALFPQHRFDGFYDTTTVTQEIDLAGSVNCEVRQDESGKSFIAPRDPEKLAIVRVTILKDFNDYVFFPRVSQGSEVLVCENTPENILFRLSSGQGWTPLGRRYLLDLACGEHGDLRKQYHLPLLVVLRGPWAQLWLPGGTVFFR